MPRAPLPTTAAYLPPALRASTCAAMLAGCPYTRPAMPNPLAAARQACLPVAAPEPLPAVPYKLPQRRSAEEQAAIEAAGRPGRPCPFPLLVAGPLLPPLAATAPAAIPSFLQACRG